jgi:dTDP-4-dehydrorhamnose reductase
MRIVITGAAGQLGSDIVRVFGRHRSFVTVPLARADLDICDEAAVKQRMIDEHPNVVVHCAAFNQLDQCEALPDEAFQVNAIGALNVARACAAVDAYCLYISTDYVFDGLSRKPYEPTDAVGPLSVYGVSKLSGELLVRAVAPRFLIVRVSSLFGRTGSRGKGGNFVEAILRKAREREPLPVVADQWMSPTYTLDAAQALLTLVERRMTGVMHVANANACTWHTFARAIVSACHLDVDVEAVALADYAAKSRRPAYSVLQPSLPMRPWQEALTDYLVEKGHIQKPAPTT